MLDCKDTMRLRKCVKDYFLINYLLINSFFVYLIRHLPALLLPYPTLPHRTGITSEPILPKRKLSAEFSASAHLVSPSNQPSIAPKSPLKRKVSIEGKSSSYIYLLASQDVKKSIEKERDIIVVDVGEAKNVMNTYLNNYNVKGFSRSNSFVSSSMKDTNDSASTNNVYDSVYNDDYDNKNHDNNDNLDSNNPNNTAKKSSTVSMVMTAPSGTGKNSSQIRSVRANRLVVGCVLSSVCFF